MLTIGLFFGGLLAYALVSRLLDRASVSAQIVMLVLGIGLGLTARGTAEAVFDTDLLGVAGELALILALVVDAARIDFAALRQQERPRLHADSSRIRRASARSDRRSAAPSVAPPWSGWASRACSRNRRWMRRRSNAPSVP